MHHPTDRITHTTAFVTPVVEHWLEREIAQRVHPMKDRSDDPPHHERTRECLTCTFRASCCSERLCRFLCPGQGGKGGGSKGGAAFTGGYKGVRAVRPESVAGGMRNAPTRPVVLVTYRL